MSDSHADVLTGGFDPERFFALMRSVGHGRALGLDYRASGENWVELALPWREELVGVPASGILASGAIVSLVDTAGGASVWMALGHFQPIVTIDLRLDYLRPAVRNETVIARCECYKLTQSIGFVRGVAHGEDERRPIAQAMGTFMLNP
ncbi:MAG: PaaI family thioesterase [Sphingomonas bacterium]|nr:PaaI family thioesterase [Sphingomonas bacterium]